MDILTLPIKKSSKIKYENLNLVIDKSDLSYDIWFYSILSNFFIVFAVIYIPYILYKSNKLLKDIRKKVRRKIF